MVTGYSQQVQYFDDFLLKKLSALRTDAQRICWNDSTYEDVLADNILKVRERIAKSGFTGSNHFGYVWRGMSNQYKLQKKRQNKRGFIDYSEPSIQAEIQCKIEDQSHNSQSYYDNLEVLVKYLFRYIALHYNDKQALLFKTYYLTSSNTYQKLVESTGLTFKYVKDAISMINRDLRTNLVNFVKYELAPEVFRPVRNYEGLYEISNKGRLKNSSTGIIKTSTNSLFKLWKNNQYKYKSASQLQDGVFRPEDIVIYIRRLKNDKRTNKGSS